MKHALHVMLIAVLASGCAAPAKTPPTWVLSFSEGSFGQPSDPRTIESMDGTNWVLQTPALLGPVAHDGRVTWTQISAGRHLRYRVGIGGLGSETEGIAWSQDTEIGAVNILAEKQSGLAYGNQRWVAAFRGQGTDTDLYISQQPASGGGWSSRSRVRPAGTTATTERSPALAFGSLNGHGTFMLAYVDANNEAVVTLSTDLVTWTEPAAVGQSWKDPAISYRNGIFYALLSRPDGNDNKYFLYKSVDAINWIEIGTYIYNPPAGSPASLLSPIHPERNRHGPSLALRSCKVVTVEAAVHGHLRIREGAVYQPCDNPTTVVFSPDQPLRLLANPNRDLIWNGPVFLTFGEGR